MEANRIEYDEVRRFELGINANLQTTEECLQKNCPKDEAECYKLILDSSDIQRIYLCTTTDFAKFTGNTYLLRNTNEAARVDSKVNELLADNIDLSKSDFRAPVFISPNLKTGSLVALDGNHRLLAHYLSHGNIDGLKAYLYVHQNATSWNWFPDTAK